jgi:hypothetical protein
MWARLACSARRSRSASGSPVGIDLVKESLIECRPSRNCVRRALGVDDVCSKATAETSLGGGHAGDPSNGRLAISALIAAWALAGGRRRPATQWLTSVGLTPAARATSR